MTKKESVVKDENGPERSDLQERFIKIDEECQLIENPDPSHGIVLALLTQNHVVLLGPPGTGKSMIAREVCSRITGAKFFHKLMARDLAPNEILVSDQTIKESVDADGTKHIIFEKNTDGMLPDCEISFLDEIFKSNSTTLNKILDIALEREYMMNGRRYKAKTQTIVGASNETPEDDTRAFYDRIMLRYLVNNIMEPTNFVRLLKFEFSDEQTTVTLEELAQAQAEVKKIGFPDKLIGKLIELRRDLKGGVPLARGGGPPPPTAAGGRRSASFRLRRGSTGGTRPKRKTWSSSSTACGARLGRNRRASGKRCFSLSTRSNSRFSNSSRWLKKNEIRSTRSSRARTARTAPLRQTRS